jgi:hypothetical protein
MDVDGTRINTIPQDLYSFGTPRSVEGYGTEIIFFRSIYTEEILRHAFKDHVSNMKTSSADYTKI